MEKMPKGISGKPIDSKETKILYDVIKFQELKAKLVYLETRLPRVTVESIRKSISYYIDFLERTYSKSSYNNPQKYAMYHLLISPDREIPQNVLTKLQQLDFLGENSVENFINGLMERFGQGYKVSHQNVETHPTEPEEPEFPLK